MSSSGGAYGAYGRVSPTVPAPPKWTKPTYPNKGWSFVGDDSEVQHPKTADGGLSVVCSWCGRKQLLYSYTIKHVTGPELDTVGGCCATKMGGDSEYIDICKLSHKWAKWGMERSKKYNMGGYKVEFSNTLTAHIYNTCGTLVETLKGATPRMLSMELAKYERTRMFRDTAPRGYGKQGIDPIGEYLEKQKNLEA